MNNTYDMRLHIDVIPGLRVQILQNTFGHWLPPAKGSATSLALPILYTDY